MTAAAAIATTSTTRTATVTLLHLAILLAQLSPSASQSRGHREFCPVSFKKSGGCGGRTTGDRDCYVEGVSKHFHPLMKLRDCRCLPDGINRSRCSCKAICRSD